MDKRVLTTIGIIMLTLTLALTQTACIRVSVGEVRPTHQVRTYLLYPGELLGIQNGQYVYRDLTGRYILRSVTPLTGATYVQQLEPINTRIPIYPYRRPGVLTKRELHRENRRLRRALKKERRRNH